MKAQAGAMEATCDEYTEVTAATPLRAHRSAEGCFVHLDFLLHAAAAVQPYRLIANARGRS